MALNPGLDKKEAAAVERRRRQEEERKERIFNPRSRTIGQDTDALAAQVREKKEAEERERQRNAAFAAEEERARQELELLHQQQMEQRREERIRTEQFRQTAQQYYTRKEFDLNDPDYLKKSRPARVNDDDAPVSGLTKFGGEDLGGNDRKKRQQEQLRRWSEEQSAAKELKRRQDEEAERLYELRQLELNQRQKEMEDAARRTKKAVLTSDKNYNDRVAAERREADRQRKVQELNENLEEIRNNLESDFLNENPAVARHSNLGPGRVVPQEYKGMSPEELQRIAEIQEAQRLANAEELARRRDEEARWAAQSEANRQQGVLQDQEQAAGRRAMNEQTRDDNKVMAKEFKRKYGYINNEVYTNVPTDAYWSQWNTSTR